MSRIRLGPGFKQGVASSSVVKTTIGRPVQEPQIFYDSKGRSVQVEDNITLTSSTGTVNKAIVRSIFYDGARGQMGVSFTLMNGGKMQILQNEIYEIADRIVSNTAEEQGRFVNPEIVEKVPRRETGGLKTTIHADPDGGIAPKHH